MFMNEKRQLMIKVEQNLQGEKRNKTRWETSVSEELDR